jgi:hypothetical protein
MVAMTVALTVEVLLGVVASVKVAAGVLVGTDVLVGCPVEVADGTVVFVAVEVSEGVAVGGVPVIVGVGEPSTRNVRDV